MQFVGEESGSSGDRDQSVSMASARWVQGRHSAGPEPLHHLLPLPQMQREGDSKLRLQTPEPQTNYAARCSFWPEIPTVALHQPPASYAFSTRAPGDLSSGQPTQPRSNPAEQEGWRPQLFPSSHTPSQNLCPYRPWEPGRGQHTAEETRSAPPASRKARLFNLHETGWWGHGDLLDS